VLSKWSGRLNKSVWVGGSSPFFGNDDLLMAWEFELLLQKEEKTLEHYGS
jgi:hypothetical protein